MTARKRQALDIAVVGGQAKAFNWTPTLSRGSRRLRNRPAKPAQIGEQRALRTGMVRIAEFLSAKKLSAAGSRRAVPGPMAARAGLAARRPAGRAGFHRRSNQLSCRWRSTTLPTTMPGSGARFGDAISQGPQGATSVCWFGKGAATDHCGRRVSGKPWTIICQQISRAAPMPGVENDGLPPPGARAGNPRLTVLVRGGQ